MVRHTSVVAFALVLCAIPSAQAERLKDLASLQGARNNQLLGYGLVVGLAGTGDDTYSGIGMQSVATMLRHLGVNVDPNQLRLRNVAAVMITAEMPAFVAPGQRMDVTVASIGNARSLEGGSLIASPLKGVDQKTYAVAQGSLSVGGYYAGGATGSHVQRNITTIGRIPNGAVVEREVLVDLPRDVLLLSLKAPDFTTAVRIAKVIEDLLNTKTTPQDPNVPTSAKDPNTTLATAGAVTVRDAGTVQVRVPPAYVTQVPMLVAELEALDVRPDLPNRVVINERTGTVVLGDAVRLTAVAIAHGGLTLEVRETPQVSQPGAFSSGTTKVTANTTIAAQETYMPVTALTPGSSLGDVVKALNTLGVSPRDLVAILQALKAAGALRADLEIL